MAISKLAESIMIAEDKRILRLIDEGWEHFAIIRDETVYLLVGYDGGESDLQTAIDDVAFGSGELVSLVEDLTLKKAHQVVQELNDVSKIMNS